MESESESLEEELEEDDDEESLSLSLDELEPDFGDFSDMVLTFFAGTISSDVPSAFFLRFLFKIFVRLSRITIFLLFLHSKV